MAGGGSQSVIEQVQVIYLDGHPEITSPDNATFSIGDISSFTVSTTAIPTAAISLSGDLPDGLGFMDNGNGTATISGTPLSTSAGTYPLVVSATNGVKPDARQDLTLTVSLVETIGATGGTITYPDPDISMEIPAGALDGDVEFTFLPQPIPDQGTGSMGIADISFHLTAHESATGDPVTEFALPIIVQIQYDEPLNDAIQEDSLVLYYWDVGSLAWVDAVTTCQSGEYTRNLEENWFSLGICHLSEFAVLGDKGLNTFLPLILR